MDASKPRGSPRVRICFGAEGRSRATCFELREKKAAGRSGTGTEKEFGYADLDQTHGGDGGHR